ncbi:hypothetical protein [Demequina sp.]|uniref:hypothetical protein n=1 Tax=Demequina sp. TaxID=2050685 RepID=UPI003D0B821D
MIERLRSVWNRYREWAVEHPIRNRLAVFGGFGNLIAFFLAVIVRPKQLQTPVIVSCAVIVIVDAFATLVALWLRSNDLARESARSVQRLADLESDLESMRESTRKSSVATRYLAMSAIAHQKRTPELYSFFSHEEEVKIAANGDAIVTRTYGIQVGNSAPLDIFWARTRASGGELDERAIESIQVTATLVDDSGENAVDIGTFPYIDGGALYTFIHLGSEYGPASRLTVRIVWRWPGLFASFAGGEPELRKKTFSRSVERVQSTVILCEELSDRNPVVYAKDPRHKPTETTSKHNEKMYTVDLSGIRQGDVISYQMQLKSRL